MGFKMKGFRSKCSPLKVADYESLTEEEFSGYLKGNILKYVCRYKHKGMPLKDLMKSQWYLERLMREQKTNEELNIINSERFINYEKEKTQQ